MQPKVPTDGADDDDLARMVEELKCELSEAHRREAATAEVLRVIGSSPTDVQPVFDTIVRSAVTLCNGVFSSLFRFDGELLHFVAQHNYTPYALEEARRVYPARLSRALGSTRTILERGVVHIPDVEVDPDHRHRALSRAIGWRSGLFVPMMRDGAPIGSIAVTRAAPGQFSDNEIILLQTFADQAVIAIENTRLFEEVQAKTRELTESLEYQTATSEVLGVISRSPDELQPVLDTIVDTARRLCAADRAYFNVLREGRYNLVASKGAPKSIIEDIKEKLIEPSRGSPAGRALLEKRVIHIEDARTDQEFTLFDVNDANRARTMLSVPLLRGDDVIGVITVARVVAAPFTQRQINLVTTFANQAVIAINNVGLFDEVQARTRELTESLEHQTATGAILRVIAASPTNIRPVLQVVVETASRLCDAYDVALMLREGDLLHLGAHHGPIPIDFEKQRIGRDWVTGRAVVDGATIHIPDLAAAADEFPVGQAFATRLGHRTTLGVPLLRRGTAVGAIVLRRPEIRPFSEKEIALLETFADQAVIAIENTRLFEEVQARTRELSEALEQQTATSEVLGVISSSPGELEPVFQAMLENATRLCEAKFGIMWLREGDMFRCGALHNAPPAWAEERRREPVIHPHPETPLGRVIRTRQVAHIHDITTEGAYGEGYRPLVGLAELGGAKTIIAAPMLREDELVGVIGIYRQEVRPFGDKQIKLVTNFANQAVIAIENTRLLNELREVLAAADRHRRRAQGHQPFGVRSADGTRHSRPIGRQTVRGRRWGDTSSSRR